MESKSSALCLFDEPSIQTEIKRNFNTQHYPKTNITPGAPIEFEISKTPNEYINLANTRQNVKIKIIKTDAQQNMFFRYICLLYTSPSPRDLSTSRMPSSA